MDIFTCKRCGYSAPYKGHIKRHLEKKNTCNPILDNISPEDLITELYPPRDNKFTCKCGKSYAHQSGLSAHKKYCNEQTNKDTEERIRLLEFEIQKLKEKPQIINNDNKVINNNIINNLVLNDFGKENIEYITEAFIRTCLKQQDNGFLRLTEKIHFNEEHPENMNLVLPNKKEPYIQVVEKGKTLLKPKKEVLDELIENIGNILDEQLDYVVTELKKNWVKNEGMARQLDTFMKNLFDDGSNVRKRISEKVYLLLINNR